MSLGSSVYRVVFGLDEVPVSSSFSWTQTDRGGAFFLGHDEPEPAGARVKCT
jgi:hypothetical protein